MHNTNCGAKPLIPNGSKEYGELGIVVYTNIKTQIGDNLTGHHIPSTKYMEKLQRELANNQNTFNLSQEQINSLKKWTKNDVHTIMIEETKGAEAASRHARTLTYKWKNAGDPPRLQKSPKLIFEEEIENLYEIYRQDGLLTPEVSAQIARFKSITKYRFKPLFD